MLILKREPKLDSRHQAFLYQVQAVEAVRRLEYAALFHEQGLGKTKIGLDLALTWLKEGAVDSVLIVTKRSLVKNWTDEIKTHTYFEARLLGQDRNANFFAFNSPARLYLTHYEVLKSEERRFALFQKTRKIGVILDEAQKIKNPEAEITKAFHNLSAGFVRRVIMTGTPVANRPYDIWAQIKFLDAGKSLGPSFAKFRIGLDLNNDLAGDMPAQKAFEENLASVFAKIQPFSVRKTKNSAGIELPEKLIENVPVQLEERQRELYDKFRTDLRAEVLREGELVEDDAEEILKRLLRLVQVASNPLLVDEGYRAEPGKLATARRLMKRALDEGSKAILWTNFIANANWLTRQFADAGSVVVHGNKSIADRNSALDRFKNDPEIRVLVATPASAKEGLTLTVANHAIFFDRSFSLDDYLQAQDRIHRISQKRQCHIWNLIATDTVDDWVDMLLAAKHLAAQLAQGDIDTEEYRRRANYDFGRVVREILEPGGIDDSAERH
jgi:SNF2 family DNA or RNA helicase